MRNLAYQLQIAFLLWLAFLAVATFWPNSPPKKSSNVSVLSSTSSVPVPPLNLPPTPTAVKNYNLTLSASSYTSLDVASGKFLLSNNDDSLHAPASITKLILAWVARRHCDLGQTITISESFNIGTILGVHPGQQFRFEDLLYAMLLPSNNDVAVTIADGCFGSQDRAVSAMNEQAHIWNLNSTHFANTNGLDNAANYTNAHDLALLGANVMTDPVISKIVSTRSFQISSLDGHVYNLKTTNELLGNYGVNGIKTGTTDFAGENFVARANLHGHQVITVMLGSTNRFSDTQKLLFEIQRVYKWQNASSLIPDTKFH